MIDVVFLFKGTRANGTRVAVLAEAGNPAAAAHGKRW